jgi:hypothetical protein
MSEEDDRREAALRAAAQYAGILDVDGLELFDTSGVQLDDAGHAVFPENFWQQARQAKPWLFRPEQPAAKPEPEAPVDPGNSAGKITTQRSKSTWLIWIGSNSRPDRPQKRRASWPRSRSRGQSLRDARTQRNGR